MGQRSGPDGVGGWLLVLCALLIIWQPLSLAFVAAGSLAAVSARGFPAVLILLIRIAVTGFGIAAGIALLGRRPAALTMVKTSLTATAVTDVFVILTPFFPNNRIPGDEPFYVAAALIYYGVWMTYLLRSRRVSNTFSPC